MDTGFFCRRGGVYAHRAVAERKGKMRYLLLSAAQTATEPVTFTPEFKLFRKFAEMESLDWILFIAAAAVLILAAFFIARYRKKASETEVHAVSSRKSPVKALVYGAMCLAIAFVLSYVKLFSLGFGGSVTLCSMLPIMVYAYWYGPKYGLTAAFAYSLLQIVQGATFYHWIQFILDYFLAFTALGLAGFFKKSLPLGVAVSGLARVFCSVVSGAVFFGEYGAYYGLGAWGYSIIYNGVMTIGPEVLMCFILSMLPPFRRMIDRMRPQA